MGTMCVFAGRDMVSLHARPDFEASGLLRVATVNQGKDSAMQDFGGKRGKIHPLKAPVPQP